MVAEIEPMGSREDRHRRTVSVSAGEPKRLDDVAPGLWEVRVLTPAGRVLTREIEVIDGVVATADFDIGVRTASGDRAAYFPSRSAAPDPIAKGIGLPAVLGRGSAVFRDIVGGIGGTRFGGGGIMGRVRARAPETKSVAQVQVRTVPARPVESDEAILASWAALADALGSRREPDALWSAGEAAQPSPAGTGIDGGHLWTVKGVDGARTFALATVAGGRRLHVLPVPWREHELEPGAALSVVGSPGTASRVVVTEPSYSGLLSYLSHGDVVTAAELVSADEGLRPYGGGDAVGMLQDKRACPLGACAAAYALVGVAVPASEAPWHPWVGNLRRWFPMVPDGAILDARLRLLTARTEGDVAPVAAIVRDALCRGIPFYRQGFDWLLQAMLQFPDDGMLAAAHPLVSRVAATVDVTEVFTTFNLEGGA
ncbi:MAG: hypothetical protein PGN23_06865 [Sphingomonas adhaesiva]|uniref:hypothetical protein n=1 Tax=Sphingomonas adhaesiva TaxID=28212 RepID=UPI002FFD4BA6